MYEVPGHNVTIQNTYCLSFIAAISVKEKKLAIIK